MKIEMCTKKELEENKVFSAPEAVDKLPWKSHRSVVRNIQNGTVKGFSMGTGNGKRYYVKAQDIEKFWNDFLGGKL